MAEGTNVGSVYLDFVVRDTVDKQMQKLGQKTQAAANSSFSRAGEAAGKGFSAAVERTSQKTQGILAKLSSAINQASQKALENFNRNNAGAGYEHMAAQADLLKRRLDVTNVSIENQQRKIIDLKAALDSYGASSEQGFAIQQQVTAAESSLISLEQRAMDTKQKLEELTATAGQFTSWGGVAKFALSNIGQGLLSLGKKAGGMVLNGIKRLGGAIVNLGKRGVKALANLGASLLGFNKGIGRSNHGVQSFGARLRSIVSGALIFNGISAALRKMTQYLGNAIMSSGQMRSAMANLKGAAATAASPIISALTPALAALANAAATVFSWLSRLFSLLTGKSVKSMQSAAASVGGYGAAAGGAAKKVKELAKATNTLGLDELNVVQPEEDDSGGSGGSGGGGGGSGVEPPNYDFSGTTPFLDSLMDAIKAGDYEQVGTLFAEKINSALASIPWAKIDATVKGWADNIARGLNGFVAGLDWTLVGSTIGNGLNVGLHAVDAFVDRFNWGDLGTGIAQGLNGAVATLDWSSLGRLLTDKLRIAVEMLFTFVTTFNWNELGSRIADMIDAAFANVDWAKAGQGISGLFKGLLDALLTMIQETDWGQVGEDLGTMLANIDWGGILGRIGLVILAAGGALLQAVSGLFQGLATQCGDGFFGGMFQAFANVFNWLKEHIVDPLVNGIKELLGIHSPSTVFEDFGVNLVLGLFNGLSGIWHKITGFFTEKLDAIKKKVGDAWDGIKENTSEKWGKIKTFIGDTWDNIKTKSSTTFDNVKTKVLGAWTGIKNGIKEKINSIIRFMNGLLQGAADMVNRMIDVLNSFSIDVPEWAQGVVGTDHFGFNLSHVSAPQIPELASGGVIKQPTLAMMGEYAGAAGNPEIVSPRSMMREVFDESVSPLVAALKELIAYLRENAGTPLLREQLAVLQAILDKELTVQIGDETIGRAASRYESNRGMRLDSSAFAEAY